MDVHALQTVEIWSKNSFRESFWDCYLHWTRASSKQNGATGDEPPHSYLAFFEPCSIEPVSFFSMRGMIRIYNFLYRANFCNKVLLLFELPICKERPETAICCLEWLGRLKCLATGLDASLSFLSTSRRCSRNRSPSVVFLFRRCITYCNKCNLCSK